MKLFYAVNCKQECKYYTEKHIEEIWQDALLYGEKLEGYKVSNFGGIIKDGKFDGVKRYLDIEGKVAEGEIYVKIDGMGNVLLYKIIASTFSKVPNDEYGYEDKNGKNKKTVHHRDNNSYNFNPDNMVFLNGDEHGKEPYQHLYIPENFAEWEPLIKKICNKN
jgi:hypothetical protein